MATQAMKDALRAHVEAEVAGDLEGAMAPLSDHPVWWITNYRLEGIEAVRALYAAVLPVHPREYAAEILRALDDPTVTSWGDSHCLFEYSEDYPLHRGRILVVHFDGDRISGEHAYETTQGEGGGLSSALENVPGVIRLA